MSKEFSDVFPKAMGNEEESMIMVGSSQTELCFPSAFASSLRTFLPSDIKATQSERVFLQNGAMVYDDGHENI